MRKMEWRCRHEKTMKKRRSKGGDKFVEVEVGRRRRKGGTGKKMTKLRTWRWS